MPASSSPSRPSRPSSSAGARFVGLAGLTLVLLASAAWAFVAFDPRDRTAAPPRRDRDRRGVRGGRRRPAPQLARSLVVRHVRPHRQRPPPSPYCPRAERLPARRVRRARRGPVGGTRRRCTDRLFTAGRSASPGWRATPRLAARARVSGARHVGVVGHARADLETTDSAARVAFSACTRGGDRDRERRAQRLALVGLAVWPARCSRRGADGTGRVRSRPRDPREGFGRPRAPRRRGLDVPPRPAGAAAARARRRR